MLVRVAIAIVRLLLPNAAVAQGKRIALLIGNRAYDASVGVLKNPHEQGYEVCRRSRMHGAAPSSVVCVSWLRRLNAAGAGTIGFLYCSGHGAAEKDTNINDLIPVDAKEPGTKSFWDESVTLDDILRL